jgi:Mg-chelatase subunit ChlD
MSVDGKIQALNAAIREAIPHMRGVARENPYAEVFVRAVKFSHGAMWHIRQPVSIASIEWMDLIADPLHTSRINADILFMVDTSGSMGNEIEAVKASCRAFADRIAEKGATVRLGLVGFDIGGHRGRKASEYEVYKLSSYTIGIWPLSSPAEFKRDIASLKLGLFGGGGCYLANQDSTDIFPHVVRAFNGPPENHKILVIISDEIGNTKGLDSIVSQLNAASVQTHVLGVSGKSGAHESIAAKTGGKFWDIEKCEGVHDFRDLLEIVATTIAQEVTKRLSDGTTSGGTDMGGALRIVAEELKIPPMTDRALPPVLVLISDGKPTDDFNSG